MKYTELPPGEHWHNPQKADSPPKGWRFCTDREVRSNVFATKVPCRMWDEVGVEYFEESDPSLLYEEEYSYIVPDTTPFFNLHPSANRKSYDSSPVVGIPLRAHFAGLAMQAVEVPHNAIKATQRGIICAGEEPPCLTVKSISKWSVQMADALIAALEEKEEA